MFFNSFWNGDYEMFVHSRRLSTYSFLGILKFMVFHFAGIKVKYPMYYKYYLLFPIAIIFTVFNSQAVIDIEVFIQVIELIFI